MPRVIQIQNLLLQAPIEFVRPVEPPSLGLFDDRQQDRDFRKRRRIQHFVVIDAGENKNLSVGGRFSIRREHMIIGEAVVDSVEPREAVANVEASTIPAGIVIKPCDEIVELVSTTSS